jgi:hypothetical protein
MSAYIWLFLALSLLIALFIFLFLKFCSKDVLSKAISTILVLLAGVGGIKITPAYSGKLKFTFGPVALDGQFIAGGSRTDTTILIVVLGVAFIVCLWCYTSLRKAGKI